MDQNHENSDFEKYLQDINTIKNTLIKIEERPLFEIWLFFVYSFLGFLLSLLHYIAATYFQLSISDIFFKIWVPMTVLVYSLEPLALVKRTTKEAIPLFSRNIIKLYLGVAGHSIASLVIVFLIIRADAFSILPATLFFLWSILYFIYAQVTYSSLFFHGFVLVFAGIMYAVLDIKLETQFILLPIIISISGLIMGITELRKEKKGE